MDSDSAILVSQLLAEDITNITASHKGKQKDTEPDNDGFPWQTFLDEVNSYAQVYNDQKMSLSIATAVAKDGGTLAEELRLERQCREDRDFVLALNGGRSASSTSLGSRTPQATKDKDSETEHLAKLFATYVSVEQGTEFLLSETQSNGPAEPSNSGRYQDAKEPPTLRCEACFVDIPFFDVARVPCGHGYCRECLDGLFNASITDESLFPPRCCRQPIPLGSAKMFLERSTAVSFAERERELGTSNRVYCSQPRCSAWISPESISNERAECQRCSEITCSICKSPGHAGDCPEDPRLQQVIDLAREAGWQRCYQCQRFVELAHGCNHITCLCGAEFCYVCSARWKECNCAQWDEPHLYNRAERIYNRAPNADNGPNGQQAIADLVNHLRRNHDCNHMRWTRLHGRHQCEECHDTLRQFIFVCDQCRIMACWRCRNNRL